MANTIECETAVVGVLCVDSSASVDIDLVPEDFYHKQLGMVYKVVMDLIADNRVVDVITIADELEKITGKSWFDYVFNLANDSVYHKQYKEYANHIKRYSTERRALEIANNLITEIQNTGIESVNTAISELMGLSITRKKTTGTLREGVRSVVAYMEELNESGATSIGIQSKITELDNILGGFRNSDLIIVGARPAMGKTAFLLNLAINGAAKCGIFTTEQSIFQMAMRSISIAGNVNAQNIRNNSLSENGWAGFSTGVALLNAFDQDMHLDENARPSITDIQRQARQWKHQYDIGAIYVDYVQRIQATNLNAPKHERVEEVVVGLKTLAKELNIPVVALAQVNRSVDARPDKRPSMGDLKDSGSIEQEADQILMLYRDEVYNPETTEKGIAEISIEKNRHGPTGLVRAVWVAQSMQFRDPEPRYDYQG